MKQPASKLIAFLFVLCLVFSSISFGKIDPEIFSRLKARCIGPAIMSGRIGDIDVVIANPNIIYVGTATGGVWKSQSGGLKWEPIFDQQSTSSIGAVAICQQNPNIIWVGTGEGNPRNSSGVGRGIFKSIDAGKTWTHLGLDKTEKISRIVLDPDDPEVAYAAALGTTWGENPERGIFKTTDGGITWKKVLFTDQKTGAADLAMAPDNPNKLIAAMWEHRRWPWFFKSGGPGSGLYITTDGGKNWKKLSPEDGLPDGDLGRIGIAFARSRPNIVYAEVECQKNALLRSEDGGFTWKTVNDQYRFHRRPFYYSDIRVNPKNENIVYSLQGGLNISEDGGKTFKRLTRYTQAHPDYQAMWIHPDGEYMVVGTDGGIVISRDRGKTWQYARNLPLGQFYHVSFDMDIYYNVYGGLQDNGSWRGPSSVLTDWGIFNHHWINVDSGDGFDTEPDPEDSTRGYSMSQGGDLSYFDVKTARRISIKPTESNVKHRYNWNAGFARDPFDSATIYYGSQFVHRSRDKGNTWEIISPDLSTNDPGKQKQAESGGLTIDVSNAENHTTILCIAPSPVKKGVIWVGTDDGNVQLTQDDGKTWHMVSRSIKGVPPCTWIPHVEASKFDPACAFVVFDDHRRANWTPYLFITENWGKTWKSLVTKDIDGFIHVIEQDHKNKDLLWIGTEFGLYFSVNRGKEWIKWTSGFPTVPVRDLAIHPRDNDLIIGTHGRSVYILDDISFLREFTATMSAKELHLFQPSDTYQFKMSRPITFGTRGDTEFMGKNRPYGALITYYFNPRDTSTDAGKKKSKKTKTGKDTKTKKPGNKKKLKIEILDQAGTVIKEIKTKPKKGMNRLTWQLREGKISREELMSSDFNFLYIYDLSALPGTYTVRFQYGELDIKKDFQVKPDPRFAMDAKVLKKNHELGYEIQGWYKILSKALKQIKQTQKVIKTLKELAKDTEIKDKKELMEKAKELENKLKELYKKVDPDSFSQHSISSFSDTIAYQLFSLYRVVSETLEPLNQAADVKYKKTKSNVENFIKEFNTLYETDVEAFKKSVTESGISFFEVFKPLTLKEA